MLRVSHHTHEEVAADLRSALDWVESFGITRGHDRFAEYEKIIERFDDDWKSGVANFNDLVSVGRPEALAAFSEAAQIARIWKGLRTMCPPLRRLRAILDGPILVESENPNGASIHARNIAFELEVLACVASSEVEIEDMDQVDVVCRTAGMSFFIECKRPASPRKIQAALRDAEDKARSRLGRLVGYGIVAVSLGGIEPPSRLLGFDDAATLQRVIQNQLREFDRKHLSDWLREASKRRIGGVLLHRPYVACIGDGPLMTGVELLLVTGYPEGSQEHADVRRLFNAIRDPRDRIYASV